jgi:hypothetical protein
VLSSSPFLLVRRILSKGYVNPLVLDLLEMLIQRRRGSAFAGLANQFGMKTLTSSNVKERCYQLQRFATVSTIIAMVR